MSAFNRRALVKGAAWSVPVIAAAIATPLAAASDPSEGADRIRFTNLTATVGKKPNTVYVNTKVGVVDGVPVENLQVTVTFRQGDLVRAHAMSEAMLPGWGYTDIWRVEQGGFTKDAPIEVFFAATATGVTMITGHVLVQAAGWWS